MHKDALERRARIIASAGRMFQDRGFDVPLEDIAEDAGVGRGSLYRNFADRRCLAIAVIEKQVIFIEQLAARNTEDFDRIFFVIKALANVMGVNINLAQAADAVGQLEPFLELAARTDRAIEPLLHFAVLNGRVREDSTLLDTIRTARMVAAPVEFAARRDRAAEIDASWRLLQDDIRPR